MEEAIAVVGVAWDENKFHSWKMQSIILVY